jgi:hypothetical protein
LERERLTTVITSTTPITALRTSSASRGFLVPRGQFARESIPYPAWTAIVPIEYLFVHERFSMSLPPWMMAHAHG